MINYPITHKYGMPVAAGDGQDDGLDGDHAVPPPHGGDALYDWHTADLVTTLPAELRLDPAAIMGLRGTLFPSVKSAYTKARNFPVRTLLIPCASLCCSLCLRILVHA